MSKVNRFSLEERYGYQNRKVIYDKDADNDIELNSIYPIIDLLNQLDEQIPDLQHRLEVAEKALELACETIKEICGKPLCIGGNVPTPETKDSEYFIIIAKEMLENEKRR